MVAVPVTDIDRRRARRKTGKKSTSIACRKGSLGLGPNLAIKLVDLSEEGARLRVKEQIASGTEVEIALTGVGLSKPFVVMAVVVWCRMDQNEFLMGVKFRGRVSYVDFMHLT